MAFPAWSHTGDTLRLPVFEKTALRLAQTKPFVFLYQADSATLDFYRQGDISMLIGQTTPMMMRTYGPGFSASVSSRGLATAHTGLYWNDINLQSPTTGIADISLIPAAFVDHISFTAGGASSTMGSGLLGGGIHLNPQSSLEKDYNVSLNNTFTSLGNAETAATLHFANDHLVSETRVLYSYAQNRFEYVNHARRDKPLNTRENNAFEQYGLTQNLQRRFGKHKLEFSLWALETWRELPPSLTSSYDGAYQQDLNFRAQLAAHLHYGNWNARIQGAFLHDEMLFRNDMGVNSFIYSQTALINADFNGLIGDNWEWRAGSQNSFQEALAENNYVQRHPLFNAAIYAGLTHHASNRKWTQNLQLRQDFYSGYQHPFSPSYSVSFMPSSRLHWSASAGRNFRIPGFNDRFWMPGGNPDLPPEDAWSMQSGPEIHLLKRKDGKGEWTMQVLAFYNWVNNWIQWIPTGNYWGAVSYKSVVSQGINARTTYRLQLERWVLSASADYAFTDARNDDTPFNDAIRGEVLPHIPKHKANAMLTLGWKNWSFYADGSYTGSRFITPTGSRTLPAFWLVHSGLSWKGNVNRVQAIMRLRVHNLFNHDYQIMPWMPMPLRHYSASLEIRILKPKKNKS